MPAKPKIKLNKMKIKIISILIASLFTLNCVGQVNLNLSGITTRKFSNKIPKGTQIHVNRIIENARGSVDVELSVNNEIQYCSYGELKNISFEANSITDLWTIEALNREVYETLINNGFQNEVRAEYDKEANEYFKFLKGNNLIFEDQFLESYISTLLSKIYPDKLKDGRASSLNIHIRKDNEPNAFIFPNGTLFISTGLLSTINSEDELIGVLAHEITHMVLDHSIVNYIEEQKREQRGMFWSAIATGAVAAAEVVMASKNEYYIPGNLTLTTAMLARDVSQRINKRLGILCSQNQEYEADEVACKVLIFLKKDKYALSSALQKIKNSLVESGNYNSLENGSETHPAIENRIKEIGLRIIPIDNNYMKNISFVTSYNAMEAFIEQNLELCKDLVEKNINVSVATQDDYILISKVTLLTKDDKESNAKALEYIAKAKKYKNLTNINLYKQEALVYIRLKNKEEGKISLEKYLELVSAEKSKLEKIKNEKYWLQFSAYCDKESEWTINMIDKIEQL